MYIAFNKSGKSFTRTTNREYEYAIFTGTTRNRPWEYSGEYQSDDFTDRMAGRIDLAEKVQAELNKLGYVDAYIAPVEAIQIEKAAPKQWEATADGRTITATTKKELIEMIDNGAFDRPEETPAQEEAPEAEEAPAQQGKEATEEEMKEVGDIIAKAGFTDSDLIGYGEHTVADFKEAASKLSKVARVWTLMAEGDTPDGVKNQMALVLLAYHVATGVTEEAEEEAPIATRVFSTEACGEVTLTMEKTKDPEEGDGEYSVVFEFPSEFFDLPIEGKATVTSALTSDEKAGMLDWLNQMDVEQVEGMYRAVKQQIEELTDE